MRGEENFGFFILVSLLLNCKCPGETSVGADSMFQESEQGPQMSSALRRAHSN